MMIRKRSLKVLSLVVSIILITTLLAGCDDTSKYRLGEPIDATYFEKQHIFLDAGETYKLDIKKIFKHSGVNISSYEVYPWEEGIVNVRKNVITAQGMGATSLRCYLYEKSTKKYYLATLGYVYVTDGANMIPITTAEDLDNIRNNLQAHYILKNNIDLKDWGEWLPIDTFEGSFVNEGGFEISNLTITNASDGGLFGGTKGAYIDGLVLTNVSIDLLSTSFKDTCAGGIAVFNSGGDDGVGAIVNCTVDGIIKAQFYTGGICASNSGKIINCSFNGTVITFNTNVSLDKDNECTVGGIVGFNWGIVQDCVAGGIITGSFSAGGIVGINYDRHGVGNEIIVIGCSFNVDGRINGPVAGWIIGWQRDKSRMTFS